MTCKDIVFWGATGQARVLRECVEHLGHRVIAVFDNNPAVAKAFDDVPLYSGWAGFREWHKTASGPVAFLVAIGGTYGRDRCDIQIALSSEGLLPFTAVHPTAFVATDAAIGPGSQVLAQSAICAGARLGAACIVNTCASVDHECVLEDGVHVAPGARLAGLVRVAPYAMIGTGAIVLPRLRIGRNSVIGAGAVVTRDVPDNAIVAGNPARTIKERKTT